MKKQEYKNNLKGFKKALNNILTSNFKVRCGRVTNDIYCLEWLGREYLQIKEVSSNKRIAKLPLSIINNIDTLKHGYTLMGIDL